MMVFNYASVLSLSHMSHHIFLHHHWCLWNCHLPCHVLQSCFFTIQQQSEGILGRLSVVQSLHLHTITPDIKNEKDGEKKDKIPPQDSCSFSWDEEIWEIVRFLLSFNFPATAAIVVIHAWSWNMTTQALKPRIFNCL